MPLIQRNVPLTALMLSCLTDASSLKTYLSITTEEPQPTASLVPSRNTNWPRPSLRGLDPLVPVHRLLLDQRSVLAGDCRLDEHGLADFLGGLDRRRKRKQSSDKPAESPTQGRHSIPQTELAPCSPKQDSDDCVLDEVFCAKCGPNRAHSTVLILRCLCSVADRATGFRCRFREPAQPLRGGLDPPRLSRCRLNYCSGASGGGQGQPAGGLRSAGNLVLASPHD